MTLPLFADRPIGWAGADGSAVWSMVAGSVAGKYARAIAATAGGGSLVRESAPSDFATTGYGWTVESYVYLPALAEVSVLSLVGPPGTSNATGTRYVLSVYLKSNGTPSLYFEGSSGTGVTIESAGATITAGAWHHVAWTRPDPAHVYFYVDGVAWFTSTASGAGDPTPYDAEDWYVGINRARLRSNVQIQALTYSTTARDATWIAASYAALSTTGELPTDADTLFGIQPATEADVWLPIAASGVLPISPAAQSMRTGQQLERSTYSQGYEDGYVAGYSAGDAAGYAAGYAAGFAAGLATEPEVPTPPTPVPLPVTFADPEYVDHVASAVSHLPQQFRGDPWRGW